MDFATPLSVFPGVGAARARALGRLGLVTVGDLLEHYPRGYEDRTLSASISQAPSDRAVCISAVVAESPRIARIRKGLELVKVPVVDGGGRMELTFFNQTYVKDALRVGEEYVFYGVAEGAGSRRRMTNPVFEAAGRPRFTGRIMPVYPLTAGVSNNLLSGLVERALGGCSQEPEELLPPGLRQEHALCSIRFAQQNIHFPQDWQALAAARKRLTFQEFFLFSLGLELLRRRRDVVAGRRLEVPAADDFLGLLPFSPTGAQRRAMGQVADDLASGKAMNRLIQGDVGSGKTAVAAYAAWAVVKRGCQAALMAPTEILAEQHYRTLSALLAPAGVQVGLLTGALSAAEKRAVRSGLKSGEIDFVVGTHALLTGTVAFHDLALVITDEQHRFGVAQRSALAAKGGASGGPGPHVLVMSATPIPRTLALILYGDLDVSVLDELPPGRSPVQTFLVGEDKRQRMLGFVRKQVQAGRQVYIVCPAVEEQVQESGPGATAGAAPELDLKAAQVYARQLQSEVFPDLRVGLVHGKLKPKEKDAVMRAFAAGELDVLVATTVIEVGVDVPNANLMIIENAERFGLSQLHQLRGRVGRGEWQSYCVLVSSNHGPETLARLKALCATTDGFRIAEEDLKLRGPGDFFGQRQHGLPQLRVASFVEDVALLSQARAAAAELLQADPGLEAVEHRPLLRQVRALFARQADSFN